MKKIISILLLLSLFIFAACSSQEQTRQTDVTVETSSADTQRKEAEGLDETQDQINEALTSLTQVGSYNSPAGEDTIEVTLTLNDQNIVQDVEIDYLGNNGISRGKISDYEEGIKDIVIGQNINDVESPEKVNGSSLTSIGFNEAVNKMKAQI